MISKSSYVNYYICPKKFWLHLHKKEEETPLDAMAKQNIEDGNRLGELARSYFLNTYNASFLKDGIPVYSKQIENTKNALLRNEECIAEASFSFGELYCAVDLLKKDPDGYSIYEVKSTFDIDDEKLVDVAFQKYVLEKCGLKINEIYILHPNRDYKRIGDINVKTFFSLENVTNNNFLKEKSVSMDSEIANVISLNSRNVEPILKFNKKCDECSFYDYCHKKIPINNVKNLYRVKAKAEDYYNSGIFTIDDYLNKIKPNLKGKTKKRLRVQIDAYLNKKDVIVDKDEVKKFLEKLKYPLYHLDFETSKNIIPEFDGIGPNESYPFQYSLQIEKKDGNIETKAFLGDDLDCRRALAEQLIKDIPQNSCVLAFNSSTEEGIIRNLAKIFPDLALKLINIANNIVDLLEPFEKGHYYNIKQGKSNSIKDVLPALCPEMEEAYHNLPIVHKGTEALIMFRKLINEYKGTDKYNEVRQGMLDYCNLDTLAMVKVLNVLKDSIK